MMADGVLNFTGIIRLKGISHDQSDNTEFNIEIVNPCPSSYINEPTSLSPIEYYIGNTEAKHNSWMNEFSPLISLCGQITFSLTDLTGVPIEDISDPIAVFNEFEGLKIYT